ncbi:5-carboxymethyl-2-hydroxymuconate Delta-isomerase [Pontibacterium sp.]|uniref:5-carboxymethyl-2-hydroxymuconate Delta-isomerase n=1 Tax=Pontibacterium sp. TaxID=2036026 RepID=UPI0035133B43
MLDCILEFSDNIAEDFDNRELFNSLHLLLAQSGLFARERIQSRAHLYHRYYLDDGGSEQGFIQLTIITPRPLDSRFRNRLGDQLLALLQQEFYYSLQQLNCTLTVKITQVETTDYCKSVSRSDVR